MKRAAFILSICVGCGALGASPEITSFEVVSIKPSAGGGRGGATVLPGGRWRATNETVRHLIQIAYHLEDFQILGGPGWIETERYDIDAISGGSPTAQ